MWLFFCCSGGHHVDVDGEMRISIVFKRTGRDQITEGITPRATMPKSNNICCFTLHTQLSFHSDRHLLFLHKDTK